MRTYIFLFMTALALTACAKKAQTPGPTSSPGTSSPGPTSATPFEARSLGLDLIAPSERDAAVPGSASFQGGIAALDPAFMPGEIILRNTLSVASADPGPFFTFPEGEGESRIESADYAVRIQGTDNRLGGDPHAEIVSYDRAAKRFFIPLRDALSRRLQDLGAADEQILMLRLKYPGRGVAELTMRFRVVGPLQAMQVTQDVQLAPNLAGPSFLNSGATVPLRKMMFLNPTQRSVDLWLKPVREDLVSIGRFHYVHATGHGGDPVLQLLNWNSRMQLSQLTIVRGNRRDTIPYRSPSGWSVIHFAPGEPVEVEWAAVSQGCGGTRGTIAGVSAEGSWEMDSWVTDATHPSQPDEFQSLPKTLALASGRIGSSARIRTGDWAGEVFGGNECR